MAEEYEVYIESSVRGYHAYFKTTSVCVGEVLKCEIEDNNEHGKYASEMKKGGFLVMFLSNSRSASINYCRILAK